MNTPIPPEWEEKIQYCEARAARGVETQYSTPTGRSGAAWDESAAIERAMQTPDRRVARQNIGTALMALANSGRRGSPEKTAYNAAYNFIFHGGVDFQYWCDLAGKHPDEVRRRAKEIMKSGVSRPGRAPAGKGARYNEHQKRKEFLRAKAEALFK